MCHLVPVEPGSKALSLLDSRQLLGQTILISWFLPMQTVSLEGFLQGLLLVTPLCLGQRQDAFLDLPGQSIPSVLWAPVLPL